MDPRVQQFIDFLRSQPYFDKVFDINKVENWGNGTMASVNLNKLYAAWQAKDYVVIDNYLTQESGNNLNRPDWQNYKNYQVYGPEIVELTLALNAARQSLENYQNAVDNPDSQNAVKALTSTIATLQKALDYYTQEEEALKTKPGGRPQ